MKNKLLLGLAAVAFAGFFATSCEKESADVSQMLSYPIIEITGDAVMELSVGDTYTEQGATATAGDETLTVTTTGNVDTSTPGVYTISYSAQKETAGIMLTQVSDRTVNVFAGAAGPDISGTYKIIHTSRTTEMAIEKTGDRTYRASDSWYQSTKIPVTFIDLGEGNFSMLPKTQNSVYGPFAGPVTYDYTTNQIRFNFVITSGGNAGAAFNWPWEKQ